MKTGRLIILSAPSGAGKSSLAQALVETLPDTVISVSHTTRAPRPGEQDGIHYYFVDRKKFQSMIEAGEFLEYAKVFDHYYGTSRANIEELLQQGKNVLLDIDWQGARAIKARMPEAVSIFILPPSRRALEERLRARGQDTPEVIAQRMRAAAAEMRHQNEYDYTVVNDDFAATLADLSAILRGRPEDVRPVAVDLDALLDE